MLNLLGHDPKCSGKNIPRDVHGSLLQREVGSRCGKSTKQHRTCSSGDTALFDSGDTALFDSGDAALFEARGLSVDALLVLLDASFFCGADKTFISSNFSIN